MDSIISFDKKNYAFLSVTRLSWDNASFYYLRPNNDVLSSVKVAISK